MVGEYWEDYNKGGGWLEERKGAEWVLSQFSNLTDLTEGEGEEES